MVLFPITAKRVCIAFDNIVVIYQPYYNVQYRVIRVGLIVLHYIIIAFKRHVRCSRYEPGRTCVINLLLLFHLIRRTIDYNARIRDLRQKANSTQRSRAIWTLLRWMFMGCGVCMYSQLDTCHAGELYAFCYGKQQMMMNDNAVRGQYNFAGYYCITPN